MLTKILAVAVKLTFILPALVKDIEADVSKIKSDTSLFGRVHDALDGLLAVLDDVAKTLGL